MACRLDERQAVWLPSSPRRWPLKRTSYRSMSRIIINRSSFTLNRQQCRIWYLPIGYAGNTSVSIASPLARLSVPATSAALGIAFKWIWSSALICTNFHLAARDSEQRPQYILSLAEKGRPPDYVYAQRVECEEPCEGRLSRTVLWEVRVKLPRSTRTVIRLTNPILIFWIFQYYPH